MSDIEKFVAANVAAGVVIGVAVTATVIAIKSTLENDRLKVEVATLTARLSNRGNNGPKKTEPAK